MLVFDRDFFDMPTGTMEQYAFESFKAHSESKGEVKIEMLAELKDVMDRTRGLEMDVRSRLAVGDTDVDADYI